MAEQEPRERIINAGLKALLDWATNRLYVNRGEHLHWQRLRPTAGKEVLAALHDSGYAVVPMKAPLTPSLTSKAPTPYATEIRVEVPLPEGMLWHTHTIDSRYANDADFRQQHLPRRLARELLAQLEEPLAEKIAHMLAGVELEAYDG